MVMYFTILCRGTVGLVVGRASTLKMSSFTKVHTYEIKPNPE